VPVVHRTAIVEDGAQLADDVRVGAYAIVTAHVVLGPGCRVGAHAIVSGHTTVGAGTAIHPHAIVGGDPQDLKYDAEPTRLVVGERNVIRENVTMNIGTEQGGGLTRVGNDNMFMANCHVAHDCDVGSNVILANNVMLAGHVKVEDRAILNGGCGVNQFTTIGSLAFIGGLTRITKDAPPFTIVEGHPSRVRGVNVIGLKRAGYDADTVKAIKEAYRLLYRSDRPMRAAMSQLREEYAAFPDVLRLVRFLEASEGGRQGRQNETHRGGGVGGGEGE